MNLSFLGPIFSTVAKGRTMTKTLANKEKKVGGKYFLCSCIQGV